MEAENNRLLRALLWLYVQDYEGQGRPKERRTELVLAEAGLTYQDIATLLDKRPDAVRMMLARNKGGQHQKNIQ
jgi:DNA-directed RNA polymerase specialized sigma24 family protein